MKIKEGFRIRTVMGQPVLVAEGMNNVGFNKIISFNSSAAMLWEAVEGKAFTVDDLADLLVEAYSIDRATAVADASELASQWIDSGVVEP